MLRSVLLTPLYLLTAGIVALHTPAAAACPPSDPNHLVYQRRSSPSRCEGINRQAISASFNLVSLATSNLTNLGDTLRLQVPNMGGTPNITLRSFERRYQLDSFTPELSQNKYQLHLDTRIIRQAEVAANSLRAIASLPGSQPIYIPVIIGQPSSSYQFVLYSPARTQINSFEIRHNNQVIHSQQRPNPRRGEMVFSWDGRNQPRGLYQLWVLAELQQRGQRPETVTRVFSFYHDPAWFR
ncbi:hypothetical protein ACOKW7_27480 [Limnospira platensis CENA597]|uniref:hypothetical protein n=1 Tax=Limnospira platensis TaxID=118562 RepID=UPI003D6E21B7